MVGITSSTQGEGKSTAVTIFARTLADLGLKVLVVDADMRLPMQNRYLGVEQGEGLSTLLSGTEIPASQLILNVQENMDIIPAGPKPPDPAKLLNSNRCFDVVNELRALPDYDIVLFDAPPCLLLADPILLGEKLDGILFLVGLGKVSRDLAPQACRRIKATGVDVLGLICNQVNFPTRLNDYGYEYGYYYHYAYSTGYARAGKKYGTYGNGIKGYVKRYRDSYIRNRYSDTYLASASKRYISGTRYVDGYMAKTDKEGAGNGSGQQANGAAQGRSQQGTGRQQGKGGGLRGLLNQPAGWIAGLGKGRSSGRGGSGKADPAAGYNDGQNNGSGDSRKDRGDGKGPRG